MERRIVSKYIKRKEKNFFFKKENDAFRAAAVRKFSSWMYNLGTTYLVYIVTLMYITLKSPGVGTSHVLKLWMLARSTTEFKSCKNHCT